MDDIKSAGSFKPISEDGDFASRSLPASAMGERRRRMFGDNRTETINTVLNTFGRFVGDGSKKEVTKAFYQSAANVFVVLVGLIVLSLYYVFSAFLRPLLWAVLCGVFLFPLKRRSCHVLNTSLRLMQGNDTPLWLGLAMLPVHLVQWTSRQMETVARKKYKSGIAMALVLAAIYAFNNLPVFLALQRSLDGLYAASDLMKFIRSYYYVVYSILGVYSLTVAFFWKGAVRPVMRWLSSIVWGVLLLYLTSLVPSSYRLPVFILVTALFLIGVLAGRPDGADDEDEPDGANAADGADRSSASERVDGPGVSFASGSGRVSPTSLRFASRWKAKTQRRRSVIAQYLGPQLEYSGGYFFAVAWCCIALKIYQHPWLLWLFLVPLLLISVRYILRRVNSVSFGKLLLLKAPQQAVTNWIHHRRDALMPPPMRALLRFVNLGDKKILSGLLSYTDKFVTLTLILVLCVSALVVTIILAIEVQRESVHMAKQASELGEHIMKKYPDVKTMWQGDDNDTGLWQTMTDQAHVHGRRWILSVVRSSISNKTTEVEEHLLSAWDLLYLSWINKTDSSGVNTTLLKSEGWASAMNTTSLYERVNRNFGAVQKIMSSTWLVAKGNARLVMAVITATLSTVLDSSSAVLNFIVNIVIFLTSLMYLLAASDREYIPLTWLSGLIPPGSDAQPQAVDSVTDAVQGVFGASLKMLTFYGLFTYFTHSLFGFQVVVIPAVCAALFAAIPLLGSYWVALPGTLYLGLVTGSWLYASSLLGFHFLAYNVVDVAIYAEIKGGGHPYLTGLAVAGGMVIFGLEGAVVGPLLLCCGLAVMGIYHNMLNT